MNRPETFSDLTLGIINLINIIIPLLFAVVLVYIFWKVIDAWVLHGDEQAKRQEGRQLLLIGVLVFVLMLVTWGVVSLIQTAFFGT
jgi:predicted PurR-regulated permease PerM